MSPTWPPTRAAPMPKPQIKPDDIALFERLVGFIRDTVDNLVIDRHAEGRRVRTRGALGRVAQKSGLVTSIAYELFSKSIKFFSRNARSDACGNCGENRRKPSPRFDEAFFCLAVSNGHAKPRAVRTSMAIFSGGCSPFTSIKLPTLRQMSIASPPCQYESLTLPLL